MKTPFSFILSPTPRQLTVRALRSILFAFQLWKGICIDVKCTLKKRQKTQKTQITNKECWVIKADAHMSLNIGNSIF